MYSSILLKGVWHEIFDLSFFYESVSPAPLSNPLGSFRLFSKIHWDIRKWMFVSGVNDTGDKLFGSVNDTGNKFFGGVSDTGDQRVLPLLACLHLKMKNKQNFNL